MTSQPVHNPSAYNPSGHNPSGHNPSADNPSMPDRGRTFTACFSLVGPTDPQLLPRVMNVLAKRSLVPSQCHAARHGQRGETLHVDLQVADADRDLAERLAADFGRLICVARVLTSEKGERRLSA